MRPEKSAFSAGGLLKNPHVQSILSSSPWRRQAGFERLTALGAVAQGRILQLPDGVRLSGIHYVSTVKQPKNALVLLLHGWEGSAHSSYIQHSTAELLAAGVDVFALNFRDHGETHGLNEGLFHSCRLQEVVDAAKAVLQQCRPEHFFVAGYSLGGNFALRLALVAEREGLPIDAAFAICPPVDPSSVLTELETGPALYHWYFMRKWRGSLKQKRRLFPHIHDYGEEIFRLDMRGLTRWLVTQHTEWPDEEHYFAGYAVTDKRLSELIMPIGILASEDDPVIPVASLKALKLPKNGRLEISRHGGHCGFIESWALQGYAERWLGNQISAVLTKSAQ
jgi:predicted alpha/beta-fold hydrolase